MTPEDQQLLIEQLAGAFRPESNDDELGYHKAWHDLDASGRRRAYELARMLRPLEAALDPGDLSTTARAVLARIRK